MSMIYLRRRFSYFCIWYLKVKVKNFIFQGNCSSLLLITSFSIRSLLSNIQSKSLVSRASCWIMMLSPPQYSKSQVPWWCTLENDALSNCSVLWKEITLLKKETQANPSSNRGTASSWSSNWSHPSWLASILVKSKNWSLVRWKCLPCAFLVNLHLSTERDKNNGFP